MKLGTIFTTIIAEASGATPKTAQEATDLALKMAGTRGNFDREISDAEGEELLQKLRGELPGVRRWLAEGARRAEGIRADGRNRAARRAAARLN